MSSADSSARDDAVPVVDPMARALEARRLHHRQMIRRGIVLALVLALVGLLTAITIPVANQLRASWLMESAGFRVDWDLNRDNWMSGGVSHVTYKQGSWLQGPHDLELQIVPRLLNVESVSLQECDVTEAGLAPLSKLGRLQDLNLSRLYHLRYGATVTGLSDGCLTSIQGLSQLKNLSLSGNRITDTGLAVIARMSQLETLDLTATDVTDAGLAQLKALKKLRVLSVGGSFVTPEAARALQSALPGLEVEFLLDPELERNLKAWRKSH